MFLKSTARADARALLSVVLLDAALGLLLGSAYFAGGAARVAHAGVPQGAAARADSRRPPVLRTSFSTPPALQAPPRLKPGHSPAGSSALDCLTQAVYYEARGESAEGQQAVAQVVLNRLRRPGFPKTVCGVVFQGVQDGACQFSFACDGAMRAPKEAIAWRRAQDVAAHALDGFELAEIGDATNFHVASLGAIWGDGLVRVAQIGAHTFYRLTGRPDPAMQGPTMQAPAMRAPAAPAQQLAQQSVHAEGKSPSDDGTGSSLILAAAITPVAINTAGPPRAAAEPDAAPPPAPAHPADKTAAGAPAPAAAKGAG